MVLECLPIGMFGSNCFIIGQNGEGAVIDAGVDSEAVCRTAETKGLKIKYIILTHGHIDHIFMVDELREKTGAQVLIHEGDAGAFADAARSGAYMVGATHNFGDADRFVKDGDVLEVGGLKLEIIHTPGHTPGGICIKVENNLFTGDTLFMMSIGRTDMEGGSFEVLMDSIMNRLMLLDESLKVYPGHGDPTSIGAEKKHNPFVKMAREGR